MDGGAIRQAESAAAIVRELLGDGAVAAYVYGSATMAGLRRDSDIDVLVLSARQMTKRERGELARRLLPISGRWRSMAADGLRPIEVTVVARPDIEPWRYPGVRDFQYGEWLRKDVEAGGAGLGPAEDPDVGLLVTMVRQFGRTLFGPDAGMALPEIPARDLRAALLANVDAVIPGLRENDDTTNGMLTLARVWYTLETGEFVAKDTAGIWAASCLSFELGGALHDAVRVYRGESVEDPERRSGTLTAAEAMISAIRAVPERSA